MHRNRSPVHPVVIVPFAMLVGVGSGAEVVDDVVVVGAGLVGGRVIDAV